MNDENNMEEIKENTKLNVKKTSKEEKLFVSRKTAMILSMPIVADIKGAASTLIVTEGRDVPEAAIDEAARFAVAYSKAFARGLGVADAYWVKPEQVKTAAKPGEFLAKGAFVIDGKKIGKVKIGRSDMYTVFEDKKYATRELTLVFKGLVKVYAFTFG